MIDIKRKKSFTDEEDYVYSLMGWLVANADDDLTKKYLNHRNRRFFKHSLEKIRDHLEVTGWYEYPGKHFNSSLGHPYPFNKNDDSLIVDNSDHE
jgi:hypothetical protein|tara:strand:+ start:200 stop:484 length:285 start_codon:yes stop_codon:yes gene_type:complete